MTTIGALYLLGAAQGEWNPTIPLLVGTALGFIILPFTLSSPLDVTVNGLPGKEYFLLRCRTVQFERGFFATLFTNTKGFSIGATGTTYPWSAVLHAETVDGESPARLVMNTKRTYYISFFRAGHGKSLLKELRSHGVRIVEM